MKRITVLAVSLMLAGSAYAGTVRDNCGCGVGTLAFGDQEGLVSQVLAATFNGVSGNQTFGITSGTLDCQQFNGLTSNRQIRQFVTDNMDQLAIDMAMGQGQSLEALADLMNVKKDDRATLYGSLQQNFDRIFTSENVTPAQVVAGIAEVTKG
jgi:hypothetical protein